MSGYENTKENVALIPNAVLFNRRATVKKGATCSLSEKDIDYKDVQLLTQYVSTSKCRILPSRITDSPHKIQRKLKQAIRRARVLALLPFSKN